MGLNYGVFSLLESSKCIAASSQNGECDVLTLGRMNVFLSEEQKLYFSKKFGVPLKEFSDAENILKAVGCSSVSSLDYSDYEGADHIWNLNIPIVGSEQESNLINKYNLILDYGTTEHVFSPPQSIANLIRMLKVGGRLNLMLPVCGSLDHGMYQFSPNWFYSMNSEYLELERLYFYVNQNLFKMHSKSIHLKIWDGLSEQFKEHVDGTFDGSYQANLLQYTHELIYSFAIFKKKKELDEKRFMEEVHQLIYTKFWEDKDRVRYQKDPLRNKTKIFIENFFPKVIKTWIYQAMINSSVIKIEKVSPL